MTTLKKLKMSKKKCHILLKKLSSLTLLKWDSIMDIFLGNVPTFLGGGGWGECAFQFAEIFHFVEMQSTFC